MAKQNLTSKSKSNLIGVFFKMNPKEKKRLKMYCVKNNTNVTEVILKGIELEMARKK
tara:strand:- start:1394 stop:1564 length:171 start_codon:yes stop_codon:yes gene_type:complete